MNIQATKPIPDIVAGAIFSIILWSLFIVAYFMIGFNVPLFLIVAGVTFTLSVFYPQSGLYAIVFLTIVFERFFTLIPIVFGRMEIKLYPLDILMGGVLLGILLLWISGKIKPKLRWYDGVLFIFMLFVTGYFVFTVASGSAETAVAFSVWKNYAFYALLYFIASLLLQTARSRWRLLQFFLVGAVASIGFLIAGAVLGEGLWSEYTPLTTSGVRILAFPHAYYFALACIGGVIMLAHSHTMASKKYLVWLLPIWLVGVLGSLMRHLWIGLAIAFVSAYFLIPKKRRVHVNSLIRTYGLAVLIGLVGSMYLLFFLPQSDFSYELRSISGSLYERVLSITNTYDESGHWRGVVWSQAFSELSEDPLLGIGIGEKVAIQIGDYQEYVEVRNMHNSFFALLVQFGIVGFGLFIIWFGRVTYLGYQRLRELYREDRYDPILLMSIIIIVFQTVIFFFQPYLETNLLGVFFWINIGLLRSLLSDDPEEVR